VVRRNIGFFLSVSTNSIFKEIMRRHAATHRQRVRIVEHVLLFHSSVALVNDAHCRVLLVQPRALHISFRLRVVFFVENLTCHVRNDTRALLVHRPDMASSIFAIDLLVGI